MIAMEQEKIGRGSITVYDPRLITKSIEFPSINGFKMKFTPDDDVSDYDLIIGVYPAQASELIVNLSCEYKKDFYVADITAPTAGKIVLTQTEQNTITVTTNKFNESESARVFNKKQRYFGLGFNLR
jgi:hypothetical protein